LLAVISPLCHPLGLLLEGLVHLHQLRLEVSELGLDGSQVELGGAGTGPQVALEAEVLGVLLTDFPTYAGEGRTIKLTQPVQLLLYRKE
jgi:hypothetical protein